MLQSLMGLQQILRLILRLRLIHCLKGRLLQFWLLLLNIYLLNFHQYNQCCLCHVIPQIYRILRLLRDRRFCLRSQLLSLQLCCCINYLRGLKPLILLKFLIFSCYMNFLRLRINQKLYQKLFCLQLIHRDRNLIYFRLV